MRPQNASSSSPIGTVLRIGPQGVLVVESDGEAVDLGTRCQTGDGGAAGVVVDVIGPVDAPLLVVDPNRGPKRKEGTGPGASDGIVGSALYAR